MARKKQEIALQKELNTQEEWDETMGKEGLFIIDIYQEWCGPCKSIVSLFRRLKNESGEDLLQFSVAKADTIDSLVRYRGTCRPCFLFYGSGTLVDVVRGVNPPELEKKIKHHLTNELNVLKGEPGTERVEIRDPAFKEIDEAEKRAKERAEEEEEEEREREVTVVLIKPDAMDKVDEIKQQLEERGIEILEQQERQLTDEEARDFYRHLEDQEWFEQMISYMINGISTVLVIAKDNEGIISEFREILGPAIVEEAKEKEPESLRAIFGSESFKNAIHAADSGEKAQQELQFFFPEFRVPTYKVSKPKQQQRQEVEKTVALIRPDAFLEFKDEILAKINEAGFHIALQKEVQLTREKAEEFYSEKKDSPYFEELINRMTNGPVLALALAKQGAIRDWRTSLGEKDPKEAKTSNPSSLRAMYSKEDIEINLLHGSDSSDSAQRELEFFFPTEQTLVIIKPDAYENKGDIMQKIVESDFKIAARKELTLSEEMARELYKSHSEQEYFSDLISQLTSGKSVFLVLSRHDAIRGWREMMGVTDPARATDEHPQSIRAIFGKDINHNAVHGSSNAEHAAESIRMIFGDIQFDEEGKRVPGTGDVPDEPEEDDQDFVSANGERIRNDAEKADDPEAHGEADDGDAGDEEAGEGTEQHQADGEEREDAEAPAEGTAGEEESPAAAEDAGTGAAQESAEAHDAENSNTEGQAAGDDESAGAQQEGAAEQAGDATHEDGEGAGEKPAQQGDASAEAEGQQAAGEPAEGEAKNEAAAAEGGDAAATEGDAKTDSAAEGDAKPDAAAEGDAKTDSAAEGDAKTDSAAEGDAKTGSAAEGDAKTDSAAEGDAKTDSAAEGDAKTDATAGEGNAANETGQSEEATDGSKQEGSAAASPAK